MEAFRRQGLVRPRQGRILGGVCAGLARRFGMGATTMRILFIVTLIVIPGSQIIVYPLLWILMPSE
jgi:phage shock protein C